MFSCICLVLDCYPKLWVLDVPPGRQAKRIPKLSNAVLDDAEHCARLIWVGTSYLKDKARHTEDERFLEQFSKPVEGFLTKQVPKITFDQKHIHDLMVVVA